MFARIKKLLKKILPPPVDTFNRESNRILDAIGGNRRNLERLMELLKKSESEKQAMKASLETMVNAHSQIQSHTKLLDMIRKEMPYKTVFWNNNFERGIVQSSFGDVAMLDNFEEMFLRLIKDLDPDSIENIVKIIKRQKRFMQKNDVLQLDLFTREEQDKLRRLQDEFSANIFKISDSLYCYKNYLLPISNFSPSVFYYRHGIDQLETLDKVKDKDIVDAGGYIGDSTLILSPLTSKTVYSFEAVPENYRMLQKTLELNQITNVIAENLALSSQSGFIPMHLAGSCSSAVECKGINYRESIEVQAITLDEYAERNHLDIGLIKVDIEGTEQDFLKGAVRTISAQKPILLLSIYHNADDFFNIKPMIEDWDLGYKFRVYKPVINNITGETLLLAEMR